MHACRWSVFFCLLGLTLVIPAYFIPAMLVASAVDGSRWMSVWTGIATFWERGHYFLAGLIFCFSLVFPLVKLSLCLLCASGEKFLSPRFRHRILQMTEWTAKYSMLDVLVIAMLVLLVKVDEFILMLPCAGLYLFSAAVLCSVVASGFLKQAVNRDRARSDSERVTESAERPPRRARFIYLPWVIAGVAMTGCGLVLLLANLGGRTNQVVLSNLTKRAIPRTMEKLIGLREIAKEDHKFWSKDTLKRVVEAFQAATTDSGLSKVECFLVVTSIEGKRISTNPQPFPLDDPKLMLLFDLPEEMKLSTIASVELRSRAEYVGFVPAEVLEERVAVANDPFRASTPDWYGRIFKFRWNGPPNHEFTAGCVLASLGLICFYWAASGLICGGNHVSTIGRGSVGTSGNLDQIQQ